MRCDGRILRCARSFPPSRRRMSCVRPTRRCRHCRVPQLKRRHYSLPAKFEPSYLDKRKGRLQYWLQCILLHPLLGASEEVKEWVLKA